ncbi:MAG: glycoside hydrolase family 3 C-terminal domain-containing protein [Chitinophagaceae bacterium]|nr:glycoside hydrolase family 3 C-terminal domain-containing protein [Chitinophagaceae bacterium]
MRRYQLYYFCLLFIVQGFCFSALSQFPIFKDRQMPLESRINDLLMRLNVDEKIGLLGYQSKSVQRLNISAYNWWNEALHGVARSGKATVFPQAIAMAATFNDSLIFRVGDVISTEARAKYNEAIRRGNRSQYLGLTFWSPNINIFRDPRWGRGQETYGEDPFLTAEIGKAFVKGLQGNDPVYLKTAAGAKHLAVHSGPEASRHSFDAVVSEKDLRETYLYAFHQLSDVGVEAIMCAYNRINGSPCCSGEGLLKTIVRDEWKFKGHIVSDCWALDDIYKGHRVLPSLEEVAAAAIKAGLNMDCSDLLQKSLPLALEKGLVQEKDIDAALRPSLKTRFRLGLFDPENQQPFQQYNASVVQHPDHTKLAREVARQSMVLLKNKQLILPLKLSTIQSMVVIGPSAGVIGPILGNYHGVSDHIVTFAEGIASKAGPGIAVQFEQGCNDFDTTHFGGIWAASNADITIACIGLNPLLEGEEHDAFLSPKGGDRENLSIPTPHLMLLKKLKANKKPLIVVVTGGSAIDIAAIEPYADAIIMAWYPGEQGGNALSDLIFGDYSPSGSLPVTFYKDLTDLPPYEDYNMRGRTYRYFNGPVQFPFGFGLSYANFSHQWEKLPKQKYQSTDTIQLLVGVEHTSGMSANDVLQVYFSREGEHYGLVKELKAFRKIYLQAGQKKNVQFSIPVKSLQKWNEATHSWYIPSGRYHVTVGRHSQDIKLKTSLIITGE